jgi:hypothetical protein
MNEVGRGENRYKGQAEGDNGYPPGMAPAMKIFRNFSGAIRALQQVT